MHNTKIEWCDSSWNPVTGCFNDCTYCYARKMATRFGGNQKYANVFEENEPVRSQTGRILPYPHSFSPTFHRYRLDIPQKWTKPRNVFVCSMADLFGDWIPDEWIEAVFEACRKAPQHRYLFLTKNPKRYKELADKGKLLQSKAVWYGSTVTSGNSPRFCSYGTYNTFASLEPLLKPLGEVPSFIKWVIIGAETGQRKGKVIPEKEWVDDIVQAAEKERIPVFMKDSLIPIVGEKNMRREFPFEINGYENKKDV